MTTDTETKLQKGVDEKKKIRKLEDDEEYDYITVPPDGGFGWIVLVACFVSDYFPTDKNIFLWFSLSI
jgi:hypothetical protein